MKNALFKNTIAGLALLLLCSAAKAQKYYGFTYKGSNGLADGTGAEVVKPEYDYSQSSKDGKLLVFHHKVSSDLPSLILNKNNGTVNTKYKYVFLDHVLIANQSYHFLINDKKRFLQNAETEAPLKTADEIRSIKNIGSQFLIAEFEPKAEDFPKPKPQLRKKGGIIAPPPPIILESIDFKNHYAVYPNSLPLKAVLKTQGSSCMPLYETNQIDDAYLNNLKKYNSTDFDYLLFKDGAALNLYNKDLKFLKKIPYPKGNKEGEADNRFAEEEVSKVLGKPVYSHYAIYPSIGRQRSEEPEDKKREAFEVQKAPEGHYNLLRTADEKVVFSSPLKLDLRLDIFRITVEDKEGKGSAFYLDKETGKPYLPKKYADLLGLRVTI